MSDNSKPNYPNDLSKYCFPDKKKLKQRHWDALFLLLVIFAAELVWIILQIWPSSKELIKPIETATFILTIGAFALAYRQWRAARQEASLEKFYDRLSATNALRIQAENAMMKHKDSNSRHWGQKRHPPIEYDIYIYTELDNLEYVIEKYKMGYIDEQHALRGAKTFANRFWNDKFSCEIDRLIKGNAYNNDTIEVVKQIKKMKIEFKKNQIAGNENNCLNPQTNLQ